MSVWVLLNLLNEWGEHNKMRGLKNVSILSLFRNEFNNKFNNKVARMLDSIYSQQNRILVVKKSRFCHLLRNFIMDVIFTLLNLFIDFSA